MSAKFGVLQQTQGVHLHAKFHPNVFIVSASCGQKTQFWANFDIIGGSFTDPLLPMRAKFGVLLQTTVYVYLRNFVSIGLFCHPVAAKNPNFAIVWTSAFTDVAIWHQSQKVEHGYTTTNLPLSYGIKIVSVL